MADADLVLIGASVHTVSATRPRATAVAVAGGSIVAVGDEPDVRPLVGPATRIVSLEGRSVLPGFQDAHLHLASGGYDSMTCDLHESTSPTTHAELIRAYVAAHPSDEWIIGTGWSMDDFGTALPTAAWLDELVGDRPAYFDTRDGHTALASTRALERAGITASTPDPPRGVIDRDAAGSPRGTLQESAMRLVSALVPTPSQDDWIEGIRRGQAYLHSLGITAAQEAAVYEKLVDPYLAFAAGGELTLRLEGNLWWNDDLGDEQFELLLERRARMTVGRMRIRGAKLFQDGVVESYTAAMLDPYRDAGVATGTTGISLYEPERLTSIVERLDAHGFQVHIHAIGDRAVRECLDAFENARRINASDARFHIAHVQFVHPDDLVRFGSLGVTANMTPYWAVESGYVQDLTIPHISELAAGLMYPHASIARAGGRLAFGSDWAVSTPDPLLQLEVAVTRRRPGYPEDSVLLPDERMTLDDAIAAHTLGSAYVNGLDDVTGSIEVGKHADLVVLDRDLHDRGAGAISDARVEATLVEGDAVYLSGGSVLS